MTRRRAVLCAVMVTALALLGSRAQAKDDDDERFYYYMVTDCESVPTIQTMSSDAASDLKKDNKTTYKEAYKEWKESRLKWLKVVGKKAFPLPSPKMPKVKKLGRIPSSEKARERAREKYDRRLSLWDVCIIKNCSDERSAEVVQHGKLIAKKNELLRAYVAAAIQWTQEGKADGEDPPTKPGLKIVKGSIKSSELADKYAEKLSQKLEKAEEKKEAEKEKKED